MGASEFVPLAASYEFMSKAYYVNWSEWKRVKTSQSKSGLQEYRENTIDTMWLDGLIASKAITPSLGVMEVGERLCWGMIHGANYKNDSWW